MKQTRRTFLATAAAVGAVTVLPFQARAAAHAGDMFETDMGAVTVHPVAHASFVMETPAGTIYVDTVGDAAQYDSFPDADLILITHQHGDHYNEETLTALTKEGTQIIANPAVYDMLPEPLKGKAMSIANGESHTWGEVGIDAIAAYNMTEGRENFHPKGRDNGYVLTLGNFRTYISGDTEDIPEMRALENITLAFLCMNLPFTMEASAAADAVKEFGPSFVYPYHYRGRDGGTQDPEEFAALVAGAAKVKMASWYKPGELG